MADSDTAGLRDYLTDLLNRWSTGVISPPEAVAEARALWLSRAWPKARSSSETIPLDVLFLLATARDMGITHDDIPALLGYLGTPSGQEDQGRERFGAYAEGIDSREREALQATDYYGPASAQADDERWEIGISDPDQRRIHRAIRLTPDTVWHEVRAQLCDPDRRDEEFLVGILEDLLYMHADEFIDRLEQLARECPEAHGPITMAHLGGLGATAAVERFWSLQDRLERGLALRGTRLDPEEGGPIRSGPAP